MNPDEFFPDELTDGPSGGKGVTVSDDIHADILLEKVKAIREEQDRMKEIFEERKKQLEEQFNKQVEPMMKQEKYFSQALEDYFKGLPADKLKQNKSSKSYKLLSGTLRSKEQNPEFEVDSDTLVPWLEQHAPDYVKTKKVADWGTFKKVTVVDGNKVVSVQDGSEVPGVTVTTRPDKFIVE